ncbi:Xaa-Pro peptidase family protein, partial [Mesorhizobium sp. M2A.F.Ca.ET.039.01.1.1]|uniref:M24 family metallopeptidase n=1 Tax=Mesorhizobium sp. M2A.F.Ca.ET.039.01.1.1 TaxID=2496746 RepID=UPI000FF7CBD3
MTIYRGPQAFPRTEYLGRLAAVKKEMSQRDLDALVVTSASDITYLTGYTALSGYVPQGLVVLIAEEEPTFVLRRMDAPAAIYETFLDRIKIIGYPEALIGNPDTDGYDTIIDFLLESGLGNRGIGVEVSTLFFQTTEKFKRRLPKARIVDCTHAVAWIRLVKSDREIEIMREAAAISDAAILRAAEVIRPGVREADAIAEILGTLARGANGKPGTMIQQIGLCSSPRTGTCHIPWSEDVFRDGSQINLELGGVRYGYCAGIMRTFSIGAPSDRLRRIHDAEVAGLGAALETIRPG